MDTNNIYEGTLKYKLIYIFAIYDNDHDGYLKIGEHSFDSASSYKMLPPNCDELNQAAQMRIKGYTQTALTKYKLLYTELARKTVRLADGTVESTSFSDHDVHDVLYRSGYDAHKFFDSDRDSEWFRVTLQPAIAAIRAVKEGRLALSPEEKEQTGQVTLDDGAANTVRVPLIRLREEQQDCVGKTRQVFAKRDRMLWDCKMRFGKTITAYALVKQMKFQKVLVVTHRPAVVAGWKEDHDKIFEGTDHLFVTKADIITADRFTAEDASIDAENDRYLRNLVQQGRSFVYFASMQDLRGSKIVDGPFEKNRAVFAMDWDLIIYDEAHEGTQTELGLRVQEELEKPKAGKTPKKVLQLSGTPYNLLAQYENDDVYSWDYVKEQTYKRDWDKKHPGDFNPYAALPELRICTFDLRQKLANSYRYEDENIAFNFREFFRVWTGDVKRDFRPVPVGAKVGDFVHAADVEAFLDLISTDSEESNYPFATEEYRQMFKHTFWILPGTKEAAAFSRMLKKHDIFGKYEVVNVAGEGDEERPFDDALREVKAAISKNDHTITLSCGRLTTGVTVPEWTGVMMLSGSSTTGAAGYMQTIFRVQSAGSVDGKQKEVCYAFDFAPDRALKVLSEVHKLKKSAVGTDDEGRVQLGEFLNFCPVLAEGETGMFNYDVSKLMRSLKRMTVDTAIKSGFEDDSIYKADAGIVMDKSRAELMETLRMKLDPQKKSKKQKTIDINKQGLDDEEYQQAQAAKRKPKKERTKEELAALEKEREMKKQQQALFDLLRNVSIRLPLLIYGTALDFDESIRLDDFISIVDDASWKEFMPKEVDKTLFRKLLVFYDEDVIEGAGMRIRSLAKAADEMMPTQRVMRIAEIFSYFRNPAKETVLTPWRVVNMHMGDTVGGYSFYKEGYPVVDGLLDEPRLIDNGAVTDQLFLNENVKILEMNSKSGLYPLYVAYSIYRILLPKDEQNMSLEAAQAIWDEVLRDHLFVLCQTKMAVSITKRTLTGYRETDTNTIYMTKLLERMQDKARLARKITNPATWNKEGERLKFDAIVGNPPYQLMGGSGGTNDAPVYQHFVMTAEEIHPEYASLIMPARWFTGGRESLLGDFRKHMLSDGHLSKLYVFPEATEIFPTVEIKAGLCYYLYQNGYKGQCEYTLVENGERQSFMRDLNELDDVLIRHPMTSHIVRKVRDYNPDAVMVDTMISGDTPFGIGTKPAESKKYSITLFEESAEGHDTLLLYYENGHRFTAYIDGNQIKKNSTDIDRDKVFIPKAGGSGNDPNVLGKPVVAQKNSVCSQTFLYAAFDSAKEAENFVTYLKTRFFRFLVSAMKTSQDAPSGTYRFVPIQDFSKPWTDEELYVKYNLTDDEILFIENCINPMQ